MQSKVSKGSLAMTVSIYFARPFAFNADATRLTGGRRRLYNAQS
jgi:hypothetical protein